MVLQRVNGDGVQRKLMLIKGEMRKKIRKQEKGVSGASWRKKGRERDGEEGRIREEGRKEK